MNTPMSKAAEILLLAVLHNASRMRKQQAEPAPQYGAGASMMAAAAVAVELETLVGVARQYIRECPELGVTQARLDIALTADSPSALFR